MDRNQAKEFYPILQAYAEGRVIECRTKPSALSKSWQDMNEWTEMKELEYWNNIEYRIKQQSEPKFRPFNTEEECWQEIRKHEPFGWVNYNGYCANIAAVMGSAITFVNNKGYTLFFQQAFEGCTFIDKQPFGIKENEHE